MAGLGRLPRPLLLVVVLFAGCEGLSGPGGGIACREGTPTFAYTTPAKRIRQTDVAVLSEGEVVPVTDDQLSQDPSFSPDGNRIVFSSGRYGSVDFEYGEGYERLGLFTATSTGGNQERLTQGPRDMEPDWSPVGSKVVFVRGDAPGQRGGGRALWTVDVVTKKEQLLYHPSAKRSDLYRLYSPVWSPDGRSIAFSRAEDKEHGLWLIDADGSNLRRIIADIGLSKFDSPAMSWSPDGRMLAFNGLIRRQYGVLIMDLRDPQPRMFDSFGEWPAWSPDGSQIAYFFYVSDGRWKLTARNVTGGQRYRIEGTPTLGYIYGALDWACK